MVWQVLCHTTSSIRCAAVHIRYILSTARIPTIKWMNFEIQTWTSTARMHVCVLAFVCISVRLMQIYMDFNTGFLLQTRQTISFSIRFDYILYEFSKHKTKQSKPRKSLSMPHVKYIKGLDIRNICCNLDIISICYSIPFVNPFLCIFIRMFGKSTTLSPNPTIQQF